MGRSRPWLPLIHRSAWKGRSPKLVYGILHEKSPIGRAGAIFLLRAVRA